LKSPLARRFLAERVRVRILGAQLAVIAPPTQQDHPADQGHQTEQAGEQTQPDARGGQVAGDERQDAAGYVKPRQTLVNGMREAVAALWHATHRIASGPEVGTAAITFASAEAEELDEPLEQGGFPAVDAKVPLRHCGASADFRQQLRGQVEFRGLESGVVGVHRTFLYVLRGLHSPDARYGLATRTAVWKITASSWIRLCRGKCVPGTCPRAATVGTPSSGAADRESFGTPRRRTDADRHGPSVLAAGASP